MEAWRWERINVGMVHTAGEAMEAWKRLTEPGCAALIEAAAGCDAGNVSEIQRLRKDWPAELVRCALELVAARRKAAVKFPDRPDIVCDIPGVEQATSELVADHKARRFAEAGVESLIDLCCGIGGDAMSLAPVTQVSGVDASQVRAWMAERNAGCATRVADVREMELGGRVFHFDPARREDPGAASRGGPAARRAWRLADYQPGPEFMARLVAECPDGAIKLGPGVDFDTLDEALSATLLSGGAGAEVELVSEHGRLVQAVLWSGRLAFNAGLRTATMLPSGVSMTAKSDQALAVAEEIGRYLFVGDPALERGRLLGTLCAQLGLAELHAGLGMLTGDDDPGSPWLTVFRVIEHMPWRMEKVRDALRSLGAGLVEVKTRGRAVDPDSVQKQLGARVPGVGRGHRRLTVFVLRFGPKVRAVVTERVET